MSAASSDRRLYSVNGMVLGAVLGSLAAALYMAAHNYIALGRPALAKRVLRDGLILYGLLLLVGLLAPAALGWALAIMVVQGGLTWFFAERLQGPSIAYHQQAGGRLHSMGRAALVGVCTAFLVFFLFVVVALPLSLIAQGLA